MSIKTPSFWYRAEDAPPPLMETVLSPLSCLYACGYNWHQKSVLPRKAGILVVCIGNLVAGGTGKTPTALAIMALIKRKKIAKNPFFLIRGYGGGEAGPLLVKSDKHSSWDTGDEALLLAKTAPTIVAADRIAGAEIAAEKGADLILMDDGLQNPGIVKDLKIAVINGDMGFGNQKLLPAGPLREPLHRGLEKADGFILIGKDKRGIQNILPHNKPVFSGILKAKKIPATDKPYIAFAGLGYPEKFFSFLKDDLEMNIVETIKFPDHYPYNEEDIKKLEQKAKEQKAKLITTEKDFVRIPALPNLKIKTLPIELILDDEEKITEFLKQ